MSLGTSEPEGGGKDWPLHVDVEAQITVACRVVKIETAIAQVKVDPRIERVVDRAHNLPIGVRAEAEPAEIAICGEADAVAEIVVISSSEQRIAPTGASVYGDAGTEAGVERNIRRKPPARKPPPKSANWLGALSTR